MTVVHAKFSLAVAMTIALVASATAQQPIADVYFAAEIWTGAGEPIANGAMVVEAGKITAIGPRADVSIPPAANQHELGGKVIIPGLVVPQTDLSGATNEDRTLTPQIQAIDGFDFFADRAELLQAGITSVQISPGSQRLMPGVGAVVQLAGEKLSDRTLNAQESLRIILSSASRNPPRIYEPPVGPVSEDRPLLATRPQLSTLPSSLAGLRQIFKQAAAADAADSDEVISTVAAILQEKIPVRITAQSTAEIRGALELAKEFDLTVVLVDCQSLEPFVGQFENWKEHVAGVILSGQRPGQITNPNVSQLENSVEPWKYARDLIDAGIPVAIRAPNDGSLTELMFMAGQFMQGDLTSNELLAAITSVPAKLMSVDDQIGSLTVGKRADFLVLSGKPFSLNSTLMQTYAAGNSEFIRKSESPVTVVRAGAYYAGDGKFMDDASIVVKGKTIRGIGAGVSAPATADLKDFGPNAVVVPGFIDLGAGLGLGGPVGSGVTLATKLGEQLYPDDPAIKYARENGITTALLTTSAGAASPMVGFKLGEDTRVLGDPLAIRFKFSTDTAASISANDRLLKSAKAYLDSWDKYEKDLAEYEKKLAEFKAAEAAAAKAKPDTKKADEKKADEKASDKKDEAKDKPADKEKPAETKKEKPADKEKEKEQPLPDPITGTWEGEFQSERLPPQVKAFKFELALDGNKVTGNAEMMRSTLEISNGSFDRGTRELTFTITVRNNETEVKGKLSESGEFTGTVNFGRMTLEMTATRTVDKSKKPPQEDPEEKDKPEKDKPADKDKPKEGDKDEKKDGKKEADQDANEAKTGDAKKDSGEKATEKAEPKKEAPKPPKKPRKSAALEPYRELFDRKIPAFVEATDLNGIKEAAELFSKTYKLRTIIVGGDDLARQPDLLKDYDVSVCTGPKFTVEIDKQAATIMPQLFANERLPFGFQSSGTTGSGQLPGAVQFIVSQGLSAADALDGMSSTAASMLSDQLSFGQLAEGKDADMVVLSGPPFEFSTKILAVMIDGQWVYEREDK